VSCVQWCGFKYDEGQIYNEPSVTFGDQSRTDVSSGFIQIFVFGIQLAEETERQSLKTSAQSNVREFKKYLPASLVGYVGRDQIIEHEA
jgi:hypothetical protein